VHSSKNNACNTPTHFWILAGDHEAAAGQESYSPAAGACVSSTAAPGTEEQQAHCGGDGRLRILGPEPLQGGRVRAVASLLLGAGFTVVVAEEQRLLQAAPARTWMLFALKG
jgi:hypothetical protein